MTRMHRFRLFFIVAISLSFSGCVNLWPHVETRHGRSSSLVDFLYPGGEIPPPYEESIPHLRLPLRVGLAFLPDSGYGGPSETDRAEALIKVQEAFADRDFIAHIEPIPSHYLRSVSGVNGLVQLGRTYGVDAVALVAYDQIATSGERDSALLYWTVVGAFAVKGNRHEVQTFMDTAVVDVSTAKLILRAPGSAREAANATLSDSRRELSQRQQSSFDAATNEMIFNLGMELDGLRARVRRGGDERLQVSWREGFGGGGMDAFLLLVGAGLLLRRRLTA